MVLTLKREKDEKNPTIRKFSKKKKVQALSLGRTRKAYHQRR
jgi:hypothetical protein